VVSDYPLEWMPRKCGPDVVEDGRSGLEFGPEMQKPLGPLGQGAHPGYDMELRPAFSTPELRSRLHWTSLDRRDRAANASGAIATRILPPGGERQRHLSCVHREPAGPSIMTRSLLQGLRLRQFPKEQFVNCFERYPGANRVVHHWGGENGGGESFALSRPISRGFTPLALDTLREQRDQTAHSLPQHARVSADIDEPRWHRPPRLRQPLSPR
jgi:hypothetical protein